MVKIPVSVTVLVFGIGHEHEDIHGHLLQSEGLMARQYRYISGDSHLEIDSKYWIDRVPRSTLPGTENLRHLAISASIRVSPT